MTIGGRSTVAVCLSYRQQLEAGIRQGHARLVADSLCSSAVARRDGSKSVCSGRHSPKYAIPSSIDGFAASIALQNFLSHLDTVGKCPISPMSIDPA